MNNQCLPSQTPVCGTSCQSSSQCAGASNGCTACVNSQCSVVQCGSSCTADFICSSAINGCNRCLNSVCSRPQCGTPCSNSLDCMNGLNGCVNCISGVCQTTPLCGSPCSNDSQCAGASLGCTFCINSVCSVDNRAAPSTCIGDFAGLLNAASGSSNTITLCTNSQITLGAILTISRNGAVVLQCVTAGACTIDGIGMYTIVINSSTATIVGINFQNCKSSSNVSTSFRYEIICRIVIIFIFCMLLFHDCQFFVSILFYSREGQSQLMLFPKALRFKAANLIVIKRW